jgi:hypothetical protein
MDRSLKGWWFVAEVGMQQQSTVSFWGKRESTSLPWPCFVESRCIQTRQLTSGKRLAPALCAES